MQIHPLIVHSEIDPARGQVIPDLICRLKPVIRVGVSIPLLRLLRCNLDTLLPGLLSLSLSLFLFLSS